jgi:hypothetical protein
MKARAAAARQVTYVYGVVRAGAELRLGATPRGLPRAGPPRLLDVGGGLWAVVADVPLERYGEHAIARGLQDLRWVSACALAHEAVVEHAAALGPVVPMKLWTIFAGDERARAHLAKARARVARVLQRVAGCQEWGVRLHLDRARAVAMSLARAGGGGGRGRAAAGRSNGRRGAAASSGRAFLLRKKAQADAVQALATGARDAAERVHAGLARLARADQRRAPAASAAANVGAVAVAGGSVVLDAVYLVPSERLASFRGAARALRDRLAPQGYELSLNGPWPPYSFVAEGA